MDKNRTKSNLKMWEKDIKLFSLYATNQITFFLTILYRVYTSVLSRLIKTYFFFITRPDLRASFIYIHTKLVRGIERASNGN